MRIFLSIFFDVELRHLHYRTHHVDRGTCLSLEVVQFSAESLLRNTALIVAILSLVHSEFEEFLLILTFVPTFVFHHLTEFREFVRIHVLRVAGIEFQVLFFGQVNDFRRKFSRELAHAAENHVPSVFVDSGPSRFAVEHVHQVHERSILHILAERCNKWWITKSWPYILDFIEELDHQCIQAYFRTSMSTLGSIDSSLEAFKIGHHGAHHSSRKAAAYEQGRHKFVGRVNPISEEVIDELLSKTAHFHIGVHVQILNEEAVGTHHFTDGDNVRMNLAPRQRLYRNIQIISTCTCYFQHGSR